MALLSYKATKRAKRAPYLILRAVLLIGLSFILIYPVIFMLTYAIRSPLDLQDPTVTWVPKTLTWDNLYKATQELNFASTIVSTVKVGFVSSLIQILTCGMVGYGLARFEYKLKKVVIIAVVVTILIPPQVVIIPTYLYYAFFDFFGVGRLIGLFTGTPFYISLINTPVLFYLLALFGVGIRSGLFILIFMQFFRGLPKELEEAAYVDGSGVVRTFTRIMVPNAIPAIVTVFLFSIVFYWNDYFNSLMYTPDNPTMSVALYKMITSLNGKVSNGLISKLDMSTISQAGCLLAVLPLLAIYLFFQRYFTEGIERTGIVG